MTTTTGGRVKYPMTPAPAFTCTTCAGTLSNRAGHNLTDHGRVLCSRCIGDRRLHPELWPGCPEDWHDVHDHLTAVSATRAGIAAHLGIWPEREDTTR